MNPARRTLGCWILAAFLERGCDPTTARIPRPVRRECPLTAAELRRYTGPSAHIHFLPRRGATGDSPSVEPGPPARLIAFPAR